MNFFAVFAPLALLLSALTCSSTEQPALVSTVQAQRLRTEVLTRYLPAQLVTNNSGLALPDYTHEGIVFKAVSQLKTVYTYDGQGRLLTKTVSEPFRPADPYGNNYTRRHTYAGNQLTTENVGLSGKVIATIRYQLNAQGYVIGDLNDPTQQWLYDADHHLLRRNTIEQEFSGGNRISQFNINKEVTEYTHDLTQPNPILNPDEFYWGKSDRNRLTTSTVRTKNPTASVESVRTAYSYQTNAQNLASRRVAWQVSKPAPGYTMAQGQDNQQLEITDYDYE